MPRSRMFSAALAGLCLGGAGLRAADQGAGRPIIRSFGAGEVHAKGPILAFAETPDECLFVGSNHLVVFDGFRWQVVAVPEAYGFRALAAAPAPANRVWIGATGAIGYAMPDEAGTWRYTSLLQELQRAGLRAPADVLNVAPLGRGAAFVSDRRVLRWDGRRFEAWALGGPGSLKSIQDESGALWLLEAGVGLLRLEPEGPPKPVRGAASLPGGACTWLLGPGPGHPGPEGMLIGTSLGAFRLTPSGSERLPALSAFLAGQHPVSAVDVDPNELAIATETGGVVFANRDGSLVTAVDHANGLGDDTVFGLWSDRRGGVWAGLDGACARMDRVGFASVFDAREGLAQGLPRKVRALGNIPYVLTDKALYRLAPALVSARFEPVLDDQGPLSDLAAGSDTLWVAGTGGIWRVTAGSAEQVLSTGRPIGKLALAPWLPGGILFTRDFSLEALAPEPAGGLAVRDLGIRVGGEPTSLEVSPDGEVWIATERDGIHRFQPSRGGAVAAFTLTLNETAWYRNAAGLPPGTANPLLGFLGGRPLAFSESGALGLDSDAFQPLPELSGWNVLAEAPAPGDPGRTAAYWLGRLGGLADAAPYDLLAISGDASGKAIRWEPVRAPGIDDLGEATSLDLTETDDGRIAWVGGKGGLLRLKLSGVGRLAANRDLQLRAVEVGGSRELDLHPARPPAIGPGPVRIEFGYSAAQPMETEPASVFYETRLAGAETAWSPPEHKTSREFIGLAPGHYVFMARRVDRYGRIGSAVAYPFAILVPWYERWPALLLYAAAAAGAAFAALRWRVRALEAQAARLDRVVAQRTRELELSGTAKNEFLESISHEIRNPLNGIVGLARLLRPNRLPPEEREIARSLQQSAERLQRVTEDVLGHSTIEFGAVSITERPFDLERLLRTLVEEYREPAQQAGCELRLRLPSRTAEPEAWFLGDDGKIRTIISNFIANAIKYAPGAPIDIEADWTESAGASNRPSSPDVDLYISVLDGGAGIPVDEQELIFQKFVRGSGAKGSSAPGSGVGLATCRALAKRMGGTVGMESPIHPAARGQPAYGSSFHLWLPLRSAEPLSEKATGASPPRSIEPSPSKDDMRPTGPGQTGAAWTVAATPSSPCNAQPTLNALVVDDEEFNRMVLLGILRELGCEALAFAEPQAAFKQLKSGRVDVIFLDLEMPAMRGPDAARRIRELPGGNRVILIATTGSDSDEARGACRDAGMDEFLLKPFAPEQVRNAMARARARRSDSPETTPFLPGNDAAGTPAEAHMAPLALGLYAKGAGVSEAAAKVKLLEAIDAEIALARQPNAAPEALRMAGHRLRSLAALAGASELNAAAARLQDEAVSATPEALTFLLAGLEQAAARLKAAAPAPDQPERAGRPGSTA